MDCLQLISDGLRRAIVATLLLLSSLSIAAADSPSVRVKDITTLAGEHPNVLTGTGLVVGLPGTGGSSEITKRFAMQLNQALGQRADPLLRENIRNSQEKTKNMSVVMVTLTLPPYAKAGQRFDVIVATQDDATSLNGGLLLETTLSGADGEVYAIASGPISTNGGEFGGEAATVTKNIATTGRVPRGAIVEEEIPVNICESGVVKFLVNRPQLETARRIATAMNELCPRCARVIDPAAVAVRIPREMSDDPTEFVAMCQDLMVQPDTNAYVIINERTGTIIIGKDVRLSEVAITHGNIIISTVESPEVSQPAPFSEGETVVVPRTSTDVVEEGGTINVIDSNKSVHDLAASLNALGVTPRDLSSIFQMLKESGALHAEVEIR
ncbi:MAG: flagellar basal body P-ring protein FlgI [Planctomyces sp.]|nr:flagellar basal body P-ring protein FlgI [Planctomyces sp.]